MPEAFVIHSFTHSILDQLRAVECPTDIVDAIGGWSTEGVGQRYGTGFDLKLKSKRRKNYRTIDQTERPTTAKRQIAIKIFVIL